MSAAEDRRPDVDRIVDYTGEHTVEQRLPGRHHRRRRRLRRLVLHPRTRVALLAAILIALPVALMVRGLALSAPGADSRAARQPPALTTSAAPSAPSAAPASASTPAAVPTSGRASRPAPPPAVPPTVSPPAPPSPVTLSYEAESPDNTRSPGTNVRTLAAASGGKVVGFVGNTMSLRFNRVAAPAGGQYTIVVYYLSAENRSAWLRTNGGPWRSVTFPSTGGGAKIGTLLLEMEFIVGLNSIEFSHVRGSWAPDLDRITVT